VGKTRPGVIIQEEVANEVSPTVTIVPFSTSELEKDTKVHIPIGKGEGGVPKKCHTLCDQIRTVSKKRIIGKYGQLKTDKMKKIDEGIMIHLDID